MHFLLRLIVRALVATLTIGATQLGAGSASAHVPERVPSSGPASAQLLSIESCPVDGASEYIDSWGDVRSGGRRHEGVDMAAPLGTPVLAVVSGDAEFKRSGLGGNAIWLVAPTGERFYYAHLDRWNGSSREVSAGEPIGYVGSSGNARGNHLHFEARVGDVATNPYPLVKEACDTSTDFGPRR
jgi:murein DD-endopeptidase MepM/ murein hydrolase activator NlpD